jgi:hypothetical protein
VKKLFASQADLEEKKTSFVLRQSIRP